MEYYDELQEIIKHFKEGILNEDEFKKAKQELEKKYTNSNEEKIEMKPKRNFKVSKLGIVLISLFVVLVTTISIIFFFNNAENRLYSQIQKFQKYYPIEMIENKNNIDTILSIYSRYDNVLSNYLKEYPNSNNSDDVRKWKDITFRNREEWIRFKLELENFKKFCNEAETVEDVDYFFKSLYTSEYFKNLFETITTTNEGKFGIFTEFLKKSRKRLYKTLSLQINEQFFRTRYLSHIEDSATKFVKTNYQLSKTIIINTDFHSINQVQDDLWEIISTTNFEVKKHKGLIGKIVGIFTGGIVDGVGVEGSLKILTKSHLTYIQYSSPRFEFTIVETKIREESTDF